MRLELPEEDELFDDPLLKIFLKSLPTLRRGAEEELVFPLYVLDLLLYDFVLSVVLYGRLSNTRRFIVLGLLSVGLFGLITIIWRE